MRSGTHVLHWDSPMPASTQRAHFSPKTGDGEHAIRVTAHKPIGHDKIRALDMNWTAVERLMGDGSTQLEAVSLHYTTPGACGYDRYVNTRGHIVMMTAAQRRTPADVWGYHRVLTWRRRNGDRPLSYARALKVAAKAGVVICAELKSQGFADADLAERMVAAAKRFDHPMWTMALYHMKNVRGKAKSVHEAGGSFAVIFGKFRRDARTTPSDWAQWRGNVSRLWGPAKWPR